MKRTSDQVRAGRKIRDAVLKERARCVKIMWAAMSLDHDNQDTPDKKRALYDKMRNPGPKKPSEKMKP